MLRMLLLRSGALSLYTRSQSVANLARFTFKRPHEPDFAFFKQLSDERGLFLDVGANAGMSAVSFRIFNKVAPILSLEPNPVHERDLRFVSRLVGPYEFRLLGASDADGFATLYVPTYRSVPVTPLATMERGLIEKDSRLKFLFGKSVERDTFAIAEQRIPVVRIDDLNLAPAIVKIDVEGFEHAVIRGMQDTLARYQPILLMEWSRDFAKVEKTLHAHGYIMTVFDPKEEVLRRHDGVDESLNIFCVPKGHRLAPAQK